MRRACTICAAAIALLLVLAGGTTSASAQSEPTRLTISTIPPIAGIDVMLDDRTVTTNADGVARISTFNLRNLSERIRSASDEFTIKNGTERVVPSRLYRLDKYEYALAFDVHKPVTFSFTDSHGDAVDTEVIESTNLKNRLGGLLEDIPLERPVWLFSSRVVSSQYGPEVRDIEWSIESVMVRDTNVVNRAQLRFFPTVESHIDVEVLFFSARFRVSDMFFGFAQGGTLEITYPDGEIVSHELDSKGEVVLESVPRGEYQITVEGAGPNIPRPVALSRDQDVDLSFLSWLDIGVVALVGLFFLAIPLLIGRGLRRRHRDSDAADSDQTSGSVIGDNADPSSDANEGHKDSSSSPEWEGAFQ